MRAPAQGGRCHLPQARRRWPPPAPGIVVVVLLKPDPDVLQGHARQCGGWNEAVRPLDLTRPLMAGLMSARDSQAVVHLRAPGVDVAGEAGGYRARPSASVFLLSGVPRVWRRRTPTSHASSTGRQAGRMRCEVRRWFGSRCSVNGAFLLRVAGQGLASPASCEVVEANGNGQPIGVTVSAVRGQPRPLRRLCRQAVEAAHMVPCPCRWRASRRSA